MPFLEHLCSSPRNDQSYLEKKFSLWKNADILNCIKAFAVQLHYGMTPSPQQIGEKIKLDNWTIPNVGKNMEQQELTLMVGRSINWTTKLNIYISYYPVILLHI